MLKMLLPKIRTNVVAFFLPCEENDYRSKIFSGNFLAYFFLVAVLMKIGFAFFLYSFSNNPFYADITKTALVELANIERAKHNLPALSSNSELDRAAYLKAEDMVKNGYFNHVSPSGVRPWHWFDKAGYDYKYAGENLAIGFLDSTEVQKAWTASPTHQANIVNNKYKEIGIAVLKANFDGSPATVVVQLFGTKRGKAQNTSLFPSQAMASSTGEIMAAAGSAKKNVLGVSTEAPANNESWPYRLAVFFAQTYFGLVQTLIYVSMIAVVLLLVVNFTMRADFEHADLLAKAVGFVAVMAVFALLDRNLVSVLIPHVLSIY